MAMLVMKVRSSMFAGYIGQEDRLEALKASILAARAHESNLPHMLLLGQPGAGKTRLALAIGEEIERPVVICHAPNVVERHDLTNKIQEADGGILFIDEVHALSRGIAEDMYTVIDNHTLTVERPVMVRDLEARLITDPSQFPLFYNGPWEGEGYYTLPVNRPTNQVTVTTTSVNVTVIGATTDESLLPAAFLSRLSALKVYLRDYSVVELSTIGVLYGEEELGMPLTNEAALFLANRSLGNPRRMKHMVARAMDVAVVADEDEITIGAAQVAVEALGVDASGLEPPHRAILNALYRAGSAGLSRTSLGQTLGLTARNLDHYWGDLVKLGLVSIDTRHKLTKEGERAIN